MLVKKYVMRTLLIISLLYSSRILSMFVSVDIAHLNANPFSFANNSPFNFVDFNGKWPTGMFKEELMSRHPEPPQKFVLDKSAKATLNEITPGKAVVGVVNNTSGKIYLSPVIRRASDVSYWTGKDWGDFAGKIRGKKVAPIRHMEMNITAHEQLARRVEHIKGRSEANLSKYFGFGVRMPESETTTPYFIMSPRSRSLNRRSFHDFQIEDGDRIGDYELARTMWYQRKYGAAFDGEASMGQQHPELNDLIGPSRHGWMNENWSEGIRNELNRHITGIQSIEQVRW